jgi:DNA polymerase-3 subunit epsilon
MMPHERQDAAYELDEMARRLTASGDYKVLRRLVPRPLSPPLGDSAENTGIVLDVETTGLDPSKDEVIELAMVKFRYGENGEITGVTDVFQAFNEPSIRIPPEITKLTGISDAMVAGHAIDAAQVEAFVASADIVIAHNASFDRKFAERIAPIFAHKPWACSAHEIDWKAYGVSGAKLSYLAAEAGFFYAAHRAIDDCHALLEILATRLPATCATPLSLLVDRARRATCRVWAERSPYDLKDILKRRGYRWNDGSDGSARAWFIDVDDDRRDAELKFLKQEIYQRDVGLRCVAYSALERFSARMGVGRTQSAVPPRMTADE